MSRPKKQKTPQSLIDKVRQFDGEFADGVQTYTDDELKNKMVSFEQATQELEEAKKNDPDLTHLREQLATANETYTEGAKRNKMRKKLILQVLESRGKL
jgi:hypothetical protein